MIKKFKCIGKGFIYSKHKEAIESVGGEEVEKDEDCVVILTPSFLHYEMIKKYANIKVVLCEKPITLKVKETEDLTSYQNIFTIRQLRYLPIVKKLKQEVKKQFYKLELNISACRNKDYFNTWKGDKKQSGGILLNLGLHYFDLISYIFGTPNEMLLTYKQRKRLKGILTGENYICFWTIDLSVDKDKQQRVLKIDGKEYDLFSKENLHKYVYQDLLKGKGITPKDVLPLMKLIEKVNYEIQ